jgi:hypothetical protein
MRAAAAAAAAAAATAATGGVPQCDALAPGRSNMILSWSYDGRHWCGKNPSLFCAIFFLLEMQRFAKTGSGQT